MKNIIRAMLIYVATFSTAQHAVAQINPGFQGKRFVVEASGFFNNTYSGEESLNEDFFSFAGRFDYAYSRRGALGITLDRTRISGTYNNGPEYSSDIVNEVGIDWSWARSAYTLSPYGRFMYVGMSTFKTDFRTERFSDVDPNGRILPPRQLKTIEPIRFVNIRAGVYDRSIWNRFCFTYGSEIKYTSPYSGNAGNSVGDILRENFISSIHEETSHVVFRIYCRVGLAF